MSRWYHRSPTAGRKARTGTPEIHPTTVWSSTDRSCGSVNYRKSFRSVASGVSRAEGSCFEIRFSIVVESPMGNGRSESIRRLGALVGEEPSSTSLRGSPGRCPKPAEGARLRQGPLRTQLATGPRVPQVDSLRATHPLGRRDDISSLKDSEHGPIGSEPGTGGIGAHLEPNR